MSQNTGTLRTRLDQMEISDVHTHLGGGGLRQARSLADIISYHWLQWELVRAAGEKPDNSPVENPTHYIREILPYFPAIRNTSNHYAFVGILRDLYGFEDNTLTRDNWEAIDDEVRANANDPDWIATVLDRAQIERVLVNWKDGMPDETERYVPYHYGEPLYAACSIQRFRNIVGEDEEIPKSADELRVAINRKVRWLREKQNCEALHVWPRGSWNYTPPAPRSVDNTIQAVRSGRRLQPDKLNELMSFSADASAEAAAEYDMVIQLFHGSIDYSGAAQATYYNPDFLRSLTRHFDDHPDTRFDLFLGTAVPSHEAANLARFYPNLSVSGAWWHAFTPSTMTQFFRDRLEILPNTTWNAFFSDGYIVEWIYGKLLVTKNRLAHALGGMVDEGFLAIDDAADIAERLLYTNALDIYGI
ncbi:MAG: hypothetical protein ACLFWL_06600 [Candidatus Brocadiia bacterium]